MTNETAPKRIWVETGVHSDRVCEHGEYGGTRYIRADISEMRTERVRAELEAAQARIAELERENAIIRAAKSGITYVCPECDIAGCKHARAAMEGKG